MQNEKIKSLVLEPTKVFFSTRILLLLIIILASQQVLSPVPAREGTNFNPTINLETGSLADSLKNIWLSADGFWYFEIAKDGYHHKAFTKETPHNWVFFPLFPLLMKTLGQLFGSFLLAGLLISNLSFFIALVLFYQFAQCIGMTPKQSSISIWLVALHPASYFFLSPLSESLFLVLLLAVFFSLELKKDYLAAVFMLLVMITRPTGLLMLPAYILALFEKKRLFTASGAVSLFICPLGLIAFMAYLYQLTGDPFAWLNNQAAWGRNQLSISALFSQFAQNPSQLMLPWNFVALNMLWGVLALWISLQLCLQKQVAWALLIAVPVAAALYTGTLQSLCRFTMVLFPMYLVLGKWSEKPFIEKLLLLFFTAFLALMTALYAAHVTAAMA